MSASGSRSNSSKQPPPNLPPPVPGTATTPMVPMPPNYIMGTQMPYALTVGIVSLVVGTLSTFLGGGLLVSLLLILISLALLYGIVIKFGTQVEHEQA